LITNDKFKSVYHRVLSKKEGSRISIESFFMNNSCSRQYGPIKELLSKENPPLYPEITLKDIYNNQSSIEGLSALEKLKLERRGVSGLVCNPFLVIQHLEKIIQHLAFDMIHNI
ncbi:hypothetical protein CUMW_066060, partial [Citrus unshiu]